MKQQCRAGPGANMSSDLPVQLRSELCRSEKHENKQRLLVFLWLANSNQGAFWNHVETSGGVAVGRRQAVDLQRR